MTEFNTGKAPELSKETIAARKKSLAAAKKAAKEYAKNPPASSRVLATTPNAPKPSLEEDHDEKAEPAAPKVEAPKPKPRLAKLATPQDEVDRLAEERAKDHDKAVKAGAKKKSKKKDD